MTLAVTIRYSGNHPHGVDGSLSMADGLRIVLFYSDGSNVGLGFDIKYATEVEGDGTFTSEWPTLVSGKFRVPFWKVNLLRSKAD